MPLSSITSEPHPPLSPPPRALQPVYDWELDVGCPDCLEPMAPAKVLFETWLCSAHGPFLRDPDEGWLFVGTVPAADEARSA
jgi:hypothetical protein